MSSSPPQNVDLLKFYRSEIQFESEMLSSRLNSFISSQSFLLIAYGSSMSMLVGQSRHAFTLLFPTSLGLLGLVLAIQVRPGIHAAYEVIDEWHKKQNELLTSNPDLEDYFRTAYWDRKLNIKGDSIEFRFNKETIFARHSPSLFLISWIYFEIIPFVLYWYS